MLIDYIDRGSRIHPHGPCMTSADGEVITTHREFEQRTHRIAAALLESGLKTGDRVAVFSPNNADAFAGLVGTIRAGGIWVAVNAASRGAELSAFLRLTECSHLIYHGDLSDRVEDIIARTPSLTTIVAIGQGRPCDPSLEEWMAPEGTVAPDTPYDPSRPVLLVPTGGTTGAPKAVPVTNRQLVISSQACNTHFPEAEPPRHLCATPMTHAAGITAFPVLAEGGSIILHQGVNATEIFDSIRSNKVTRLFLPPTALYTLLAHPSVREQDFSSLRHFLISAAPIAPERFAEAVEVFGPVMTQVYGQAEAPLICTVLTPSEMTNAVRNSAHRERIASCGRPTLYARVEIMDDDGTLLGPGEIGEVVVRSDLVFSGYWKNPQATAETRRPGGWHGTGDIGKRDEDGFVYILDRKKDVIISGGFNVFPSEVEAFLHTLPGVNDCAVIGVPDEKWGEAVTAVVEPQPGIEIDPAAMIAASKEALGSVKAPKSIEVRDLPRSAVGKVLRRELRDPYWVGRERKV